VLSAVFVRREAIGWPKAAREVANSPWWRFAELAMRRNVVRAARVQIHPVISATPRFDLAIVSAWNRANGRAKLHSMRK
jgi:hypothetical protein